MNEINELSKGNPAVKEMLEALGTNAENYQFQVTVSLGGAEATV